MKCIITPKFKNSISEVEFYSKGNYSIKHTRIFRGGEFEIEIDKDQLIEIQNTTDEVELYRFEILDHSFFDGNQSDIEWDSLMSKQELKKIKLTYEKEGIVGIEDLGWELTKAECWFKAPFNIEVM